LSQAKFKFKKKQLTRSAREQFELLESEYEAIHADAPWKTLGPARELYKGASVEDARRALSAPDADGNGYVSKSGKSRNRIAVYHCVGCFKVVRTMKHVENNGKFVVIERGQHEKTMNPLLPATSSGRLPRRMP
jgi:hypothetical protein